MVAYRMNYGVALHDATTILLWSLSKKDSPQVAAEILLIAGPSNSWYHNMLLFDLF